MMERIKDWINLNQIAIMLISVPLGIGIFIGLATFWVITLLTW